MSCDDEMLDRLVPTLETGAREIDVTFAQAGSRLGEGLHVFEGLKRSLAGLSEELGGGEMAQARQALSGLAGALRGFGAQLPVERAALQSLADHCGMTQQTLDRLFDQMRLITVLARCARIEAVSAQSSQRDFGDFTSEIVALIARAREAVEACARDQQRLAGLLGSALAAQRDFEARYGDGLTALATKLETTLSELETRQASSVVLTSRAAAHSGRIAAAAGGAIVALQSGDSLRQRLEHAIAGLRLARLVEAGPTGDDALGLDAAGRAAFGRVLRALEAAQLTACADQLGEDALAIEAALTLLADDTSALLDLVRGLYGGDAASASFLVDLEAGLTEAALLLGQCDVARAGVDQVTETLTQMLDRCARTVEALTGAVASIVLIGMNAGLRAARLGGEGRSLVVISQQLKAAADQIAADADRLTPGFAAMQLAAAGLRGERRDACALGELDATLRRSLATMRATAGRLGVALGGLARDGGGFAGVIAQARLAFSNAAAMSDAIDGASVRLADGAAIGSVPPATAPALSALFQSRIWPSYTMVAERDIHRRVLAAAGLGEATPAAPVAETIDDCLF